MVLSAVFFGISTLAALVAFPGTGRCRHGIIGVAIWVIGLAAIALLFRKGSGPLYDHEPA